VLITAGPTLERIDPVRFISNLSSGVMGYEIARAAKHRGYKVSLISGPTSLDQPKGVNFIPVESACQMEQAVLSHFKGSDCLFMASAVCDWRPSKVKADKIKKTARFRSLPLRTNPDILYKCGRKKGKKILVGFALETGKTSENARKKLKNKNLDIIVANKAMACRSPKMAYRPPFGKGKTDVLVISKNSKVKNLKSVSKKAVATYLINEVEKLWHN